MLLRIIENIRKKPKVVRQRYAFLTAVTFTALVAGVWSLSLPARFTAVHDGVITASPEVTSQAAGAPFSGVWGQFKQQVLGLAGKSTTTANNETLMVVSTSTVQTSATPENETVLLESGSTIRFGTPSPTADSPSILINTTSTTSTTGL